MSTPNSFRTDSERIPFASIEIDVRHAKSTPNRAELVIHDLRLGAARLMDGGFAETGGQR